mgnify:CR=1 FL=1
MQARSVGEGLQREGPEAGRFQQVKARANACLVWGVVAGGVAACPVAAWGWAYGLHGPLCVHGWESRATHDEVSKGCRLEHRRTSRVVGRPAEL